MNAPEGDALIEMLGLDRELLERVSHRTHQWGQAVASLIPSGDQEEREEQPAESLEALHAEAASLFTIAGSQRMLLGPDAARESLLPAAVHFAARGSSFSYPLSICAGAPAVALESLQGLPPDPPAQDRANALLALGWIEIAGDRGSDYARQLLMAHLDRAQRDEQMVVGRMRTPLGALSHVLEAADRAIHGEGDPRRLGIALHDALMRMHDVTAAAMADRYHWRRLMSAVLPVEPEAVVLAAIAMAAAQRAGFAREMLEWLDIPPVALVPVAIGRELSEPEGAP